MNDIVVTLSGIINIQDMEGKTADQLIDLALGIWQIPRESIDGPFITIHNRPSNKYRPVQGNEVIGKLDSEKDVLRVVLPLKASSAPSSEDTKQYLVEED